MGRREQPLPPGPLHDFAADLRALRAGTALTYRELAVKAGFSYSALSAAAKGETLPTLDVTLAYVGACGGDMEVWEQRWRTLATELRRTHPGLVSDPPPTGEAEQPGGGGLAPLTDADPARAGRITIAARLGAGSMGQVYLGRTETGEPVAVKIVRAELTADPVFRRRFRRELAALRHIDSPYTVPLVDADPDADRPWLASSYRAAVSLAEAVDTHGPLPPAVVSRLAGGVAKALIAIHEANIVHRDLKPANVLLTTDGLCVIDFGIAAAEGTALTATGTQLGSAAYMSPEPVGQRLRHHVHHRPSGQPGQLAGRRQLSHQERVYRLPADQSGLRVARRGRRRDQDHLPPVTFVHELSSQQRQR